MKQKANYECQQSFGEAAAKEQRKKGSDTAAGKILNLFGVLRTRLNLLHVFLKLTVRDWAGAHSTAKSVERGYFVQIGSALFDSAGLCENLFFVDTNGGDDRRGNRVHIGTLCAVRQTHALNGFFYAINFCTAFQQTATEQQRTA